MSNAISLSPELYDFVVREAKKNHRTIKGQVAYMIELAAATTETQIKMPISPEERLAALERIR
jgi:hypothetical protein